MWSQIFLIPDPNCGISLTQLKNSFQSCIYKIFMNYFSNTKNIEQIFFYLIFPESMINLLSILDCYHKFHVCDCQVKKISLKQHFWQHVVNGFFWGGGGGGNKLKVVKLDLRFFWVKLQQSKLDFIIKISYHSNVIVIL